MCKKSDIHHFNRRTAMQMGVAGLAGITVAARSKNAVAADAQDGELTPDQALDKLKAGNRLYVEDPVMCTQALSVNRDVLALSQAPWASVVGCSDSRVPPELIFGGLGLGQLFVARNAGNLVDTAVLGTLEYGAAVLGAPLIVVLAHTRCGAVSAACDVVLSNATFPGSIGPMIEPILPAAIAVQKEPGDFVSNTAINSAIRTVERLSTSSSVLGERVAAGKLKIVAAIYQLDSGKVHFSI